MLVYRQLLKNSSIFVKFLLSYLGGFVLSLKSTTFCFVKTKQSNIVYARIARDAIIELLNFYLHLGKFVIFDIRKRFLKNSGNYKL